MKSTKLPQKDAKVLLFPDLPTPRYNSSSSTRFSPPPFTTPKPVVSLTEVRRVKLLKEAQARKSIDQRLMELESDQQRLISLALDQADQLDDAHNQITRLEQRLVTVIQYVKKI